LFRKTNRLIPRLLQKGDKRRASRPREIARLDLVRPKPRRLRSIPSPGRTPFRLIGMPPSRPHNVLRHDSNMRSPPLSKLSQAVVKRATERLVLAVLPHEGANRG